uniref:Uncharacterized protein n=1 Tax=Rhizophora mucronata TaxID=61149 RepID=A0A2P2JRW1_RHIMU
MSNGYIIITNTITQHMRELYHKHTLNLRYGTMPNQHKTQIKCSYSPKINTGKRNFKKIEYDKPSTKVWPMQKEIKKYPDNISFLNLARGLKVNLQGLHLSSY